MISGYTEGQIAIWRSSPEKAPLDVQCFFTGARMPMQKCEAIKHRIALKHKITVKELIGREYLQKWGHIRGEAMYEMAVQTSYSYHEIGRFMGGRDHTTVIPAIMKHCERSGLDLPRGANWKGFKRK